MVTGDSYYDVQRMKIQYSELACIPAKNIRLKDVKSDPWIRLFFHYDASRISTLLAPVIRRQRNLICNMVVEKQELQLVEIQMKI